MSDNTLNKKVSIIVPVYNVDKYFRRCVDSLLCQTYSNIEIILVDDGSTDKSGSICDEYLYIDKRIKVIHKKNGGLSSARNAGLEIAVGEYIGFLDSDDWARPEMIEFLLSIIMEENSEIAQCGFTPFIEGQQLSEYAKKDYIREPTVHLSCVDAYNQLYGIDVNNWINFITWNKLYKRGLFDSLRFSEGMHNEDVIMTAKIIALCSKISISNTPMVYYMQRENSIMGEQRKNKYKMAYEHFKAFKSISDYFENQNNEQLYLLTSKYTLVYSLSVLRAKNATKQAKRQAICAIKSIPTKAYKYLPLKKALVCRLFKLFG